MTAAVSRKKIHSMIDTLPEHTLPVIIPLLNYLSNDYWKPVIEPASPEEIEMIDERMKEDPSCFSPLDF